MDLEVMTPVRAREVARWRSNDTPVEALVATGMAWLDEHTPGHVERFDPATFDVMCTYDRVNDRPRRCVLMHAFDTWSWGEVEQHTKHLLADGDFNLHGFAVSCDSRIEGSERFTTYDRRIEQLTAAWKVAYAARRAS